MNNLKKKPIYSVKINLKWSRKPWREDSQAYTTCYSLYNQ